MIPLPGKPAIAIAGAVATLVLLLGIYAYGVGVGEKRERAVWLEAQVEQQRQVDARIAQIEADRQALEAANRAAIALAEEQKAENRRLSDEVGQLIDQTSSVRTEIIEVEGDCPVFTCSTPDIALDFSVHNCAVSPGTCRGITDTRETPSGNGDMR